MTKVRNRAAGARTTAVLALAAAGLLAACGGDDRPGGTAAATPTPVPTGAHTGAGGDHAAGAGLPSAHVHGVAVNPADGLVYLATHDGLFRYAGTGPTRVGPVIDLMGFTVAGPDRFYASGHPGPGVDLPELVGLIESTDAGRSWSPLSRQGQSDFHALAASDAGVIGFDGALRASRDGATWQELDPPAQPYALATSPDGQVVLATTESGPLRSTDAGARWATAEGAPLLMLVGWAGNSTVAGVAPDGTVAVSTDAGATWNPRGTVGTTPQAFGATTGRDGRLRLLVVTDSAVMDSTDGGATFSHLTVT